jgi:tRNA (cmo5U34)-methyltransferase
MMTLTKELFDTTAATYDADRAKLIPCNDTFYARAVELIPTDATRILDLGAGSGILAELVRRHHPAAHVHLLDFSEPMLDRARARLAGDNRVTFEIADYTTAPLGENWDAIVSALSIHHLEHETKRKLFARLVTALKPGGIFINAEQVAGPTPHLEEVYKRLWLEQVRAAGATERQIADSLYRQAEDRNASTEAQMQWMRDAGFIDVDCWFKDNRFAVLAGVRPENKSH